MLPYTQTNLATTNAPCLAPEGPVRAETGGGLVTSEHGARDPARSLNFMPTTAPGA